MMEIAPCKDCTEKYQACHDHCDKYKAWKERHTAQQQHLRDSKYRMNIPPSTARERAKRLYIKHSSGGHPKGGAQ